MNCRWGVVAGWAIVCWGAISSLAVGELLVVGPGERGPLRYYGLDDYHVQAGAKIASPAASGPPGTIVRTEHAFEYGGLGGVRIDGGEFSGGNATYVGPIDSYAEVWSGSGAWINSSSVEIYGGQFRGGMAYSLSGSGSVLAGTALSLSRSVARIHGGVFQGGVPVTPNAPFVPSNFPRNVDVAVVASTVHLYGGEFASIVLNSRSVLHVYGRHFVHDFNVVRGEFADGRPLHFIYSSNGGSTVVLHTVPEPGMGAMIAGVVLVGRSRLFSAARSCPAGRCRWLLSAASIAGSWSSMRTSRLGGTRPAAAGSR